MSLKVKSVELMDQFRKEMDEAAVVLVRGRDSFVRALSTLGKYDPRLLSSWGVDSLEDPEDRRRVREALGLSIEEEGSKAREAEALGTDFVAFLSSRSPRLSPRALGFLEAREPEPDKDVEGYLRIAEALESLELRVETREFLEAWEREEVDAEALREGVRVLWDAAAQVELPFTDADASRVWGALLRRGERLLALPPEAGRGEADAWHLLTAAARLAGIHPTPEEARKAAQDLRDEAREARENEDRVWRDALWMVSLALEPSPGEEQVAEVFQRAGEWLNPDAEVHGPKALPLYVLVALAALAFVFQGNESLRRRGAEFLQPLLRLRKLRGLVRYCPRAVSFLEGAWGVAAFPSWLLE